MSNHPLNLALRFLLELILIAIYAYWAWHIFEGITRYILVIILPLAGALVWGIFKVDGDPKKALVPIRGWLRILIETLLFGAAFYMLHSLGLHTLSFTFLAVTIFHYAISYDRILWLLKK